MIKILDKYIATTILKSIGLVTLVLMALEVFMLFIGELNNLGQGDYSLMAAFFYVFLQVPYQVYLFFPVATLLGCLIGLGSLAGSSELIAMRSAGMTVFDIIRSVWIGAIGIVILVFILGETVMPHWVQKAMQEKASLTSQGQLVGTANGIWLKSDNSFIHIDEVTPGYHLKRVEEYQFDAAHNLIAARSMQNVDYVNGQWVMQGIRESNLSKKHVTIQNSTNGVWNISLAPQLLGLLNAEPDEMDLKELHRYINLEKKEKQHVGNYELAFWQRIFQPIVSGVMIFLAVPCIFGPLRESSSGARIILGVMFGFGFHMLNKFFGSASLVYQLSPIFGAAAPMIVFSIIAFFLMRRVR